MMKRTLIPLLLLTAMIALPILLRPKHKENVRAEETLVIISPHNEAIRHEFELAFRAYYQRLTGKEIYLDWRTTGGTSDIIRYLEGTYLSHFKYYWTSDLGREWTDSIEKECLNRKLSPQKSKARQAFLNAPLGIGIDLMFGGGQYDLSKEAAIGILVPCGLRTRHPELFEGDAPLLVQQGSGDIWYDPEDRYYGTCYSSFGICMNLDRLHQLGFSGSPENPPLKQWKDLGDPRLFHAVGLADPTQSGSINKCFEMLIQREMQDTVAALQKTHPEYSTREMLNLAWENAMLLLKKIGGNSQYLTFSASKIPMDCAGGQIAAGMCIDFYGRTQAVWEEEHVGRTTMLYLTPKAGSAITADMVGLLKGAPHRKNAEIFLDYLFSQEGQRLWGQKRGTPGGPRHYTLNRLPIRRDLYTPENRKYLSDPNSNPLAAAEEFIYQAAWTGPYFDLIRSLVRVMLIDCHPELQKAWKAILQAGGPENVPAAMERFRTLPFSGEELPDQAKRLYTPVERAKAIREWSDFFRMSYIKASELAKTSRKTSPQK